jgi:hypothetical protein
MDWLELSTSLASSGHYYGLLVLVQVLGREKGDTLAPFFPSLAELFESVELRPVILKVVHRFLRANSVTPEDMAFFLQFPAISLNFPETFSKGIAVLAQIVRDSPAVPPEIILATLENGVPLASDAKIAIRLFQLLNNCAASFPELFLSLFPALIRDFYFPFFVVSEGDEHDQAAFACDHHFDSMSAFDDPKSAAFRSLEIVAGFRAECIPAVIGFLQGIDQTPATQYSGFHLLSAVFPRICALEPDVAAEIIQHAYCQLSSRPVLLRSGALLVIQHEQELARAAGFIEQVMTLMLDDSVVRYFAAISLSRLLQLARGSMVFERLNLELVLASTMRVAVDFGVPQVLDILYFLFQMEFAADHFVPFAIDIANTTFGLIHFYGLYDPNAAPISISSGFNVILSLLDIMSGFDDVQFRLCELIVSQALNFITESPELLDRLILSGLIELLCNAVFHAGGILEQVLVCYEILPAFFSHMDSITFENVLILFANILLKYCPNAPPAFIPRLCQQIVAEYGFLPSISFVAATLRVCPDSIDLYESAVISVLDLWDDDTVNLFEDVSILLQVIAVQHSELLWSILQDRRDSFVEHWIESSGPQDLMLVLPSIIDVIPAVYVGELIERICSLSDANLRNNSYDSDAGARSDVMEIRRVVMFSFEDVAARFQEFITSVSHTS